MRYLVPFALVFVLASPGLAQTVLSARPTVKVVSDAASTERVQLSDAEQEQFRLVITTRDGRYYWMSREGREVIHHASGAFVAAFKQIKQIDKSEDRNQDSRAGEIA